MSLAAAAGPQAIHFDRISKAQFAQYADYSVRGHIQLDVDVAGCSGAFATRTAFSQSTDPKVLFVFEVMLLQQQLAGPQGGCELKPIIDFNFPNIDFENGKKLVFRLYNVSRLINGPTTIHEITINVNDKNEIVSSIRDL